jgi:hypothetical protein
MSRATAIESARSILATATGLSVLYAQQPEATAFRPTAANYLTLEALADANVGSVPRPFMDATQDDDGIPNPLTLTHYQRRRTTLQLSYWGAGAADALINLHLALNTATVRASLRAAEIGLHVVGDTVEDNDAQRDTTHEPAATQDLHLYWVATKDEDLHPIETITSSETLNDPS